MAKYTLGAQEFQQVQASEFREFLEIVSGRSIISAADWGPDRLELGLSGGMMIRLFNDQKGFHVNLISTNSESEMPAFTFSLGDMPSRVPISVIERKLNGLRTLYAIYYLVQNGRADDLQSYIIKHPHGDIEKHLLSEEEQLFLESISHGSWVVAAWAKSKKAFKAVSAVAGLVFERGREAFLKKMEAEARMIAAKAKQEEIAAARADFELQKEKLDYLLNVSKELKIPEVREQVRKRMIQSARDFLSGDKGDTLSFPE